MNQDPEMPPVDSSQARAAEGADIDSVIARAQAERQQAENDRRMKEVFAINPDKPITDTQFQRLNEFQEGMDIQDQRTADRTTTEANGDEYFIEGDKPLDPIQVEQAKESDDLEEVTNMFRESSDPAHQVEAWKLFDTYVQYHNLSREEERARRSYIYSIIQGVNTTAEAPSESAPGEPASGDESSPEGAEVKPTDGEPESEAAPDESQPKAAEGPQFFDQDAEGAFDGPKAAEGPDAEKPDSQEGSSEVSEDGGEKPEDSEPKPEGEEKEGKSEEGPVLFNYEDYESFEDKPKDEETERISIFARMKAGGEKFHERFDHFFNGGTEEQNSKRKMVCVGLAVGAVGIMVAVGTGLVVHNADMANMAAQQAGHITEVMHFTPNAIPAINGAQEALRHAGEQMSAVQQHIAGSGDTIWTHAHSLLEQWGAKPTNANILRLTSGILKDNGLSWESARHLANGAKFVVNIPSWIK